MRYIFLRKAWDMLDGLFKSKIDGFWDILGRGLARTGLTPNGVTLMGFGLTLSACIIFLWSENYIWFGLMLGLTFACDSLDGAVARVTDQSTKFGSYLDAVIDRYQEILVYFVIVLKTGFWVPVFMVVTGSLLISYNKARCAIDIPISNNDWPDLLERLERVILICFALIFQGFFPDQLILFYMLVLLGIGTHLTAIQRFFRAKKLLDNEDQARLP